MDDNDVRIASLVENIHREDLTEDEKQKTLEDIYNSAWDLWKPKTIKFWNKDKGEKGDFEEVPLEKAYDVDSREHRLGLAKTYLGRIRNDRDSGIANVRVSEDHKHKPN